MGLSIAVTKNPVGKWNGNKSDYGVGNIEADEWDELFINTLHSPQEVSNIEGETSLQWNIRMKRAFHQALADKGYVMLGRIWRYYTDADYLPSDVSQLLAECLELQNKTQNKEALSALKKLILACNGALKINSGITLRGD